MVSLELPHHAIREDAGANLGPRRPQTSSHCTTRGFTASLVPATGPQGSRADTALLRTAPPGLRCSRLPAPLEDGDVIHIRCKMTASFRASATLARFIPRRLATPRAQRLRVEKRTARVSRMCAPLYSAVRTIASPTRLTAPVMSVSPDWYFLGVSPKCAPTSLDRANRCGSSTAEVKVTAIRAPGPSSAAGKPHSLARSPAWRGPACRTLPERLPGLQHCLSDPLQHHVTRDRVCTRAANCPLLISPTFSPVSGHPGEQGVSRQRSQDRPFGRAEIRSTEGTHMTTPPPRARSGRR